MLDELVRSMLVLGGKVEEHLQGQHDQSTHGHNGGKGAGTKTIGATLNRFGTNLKWEAEDKIAGDVVLESPGDEDYSDLSDDEIKTSIKKAVVKQKHLSVIRDESDIEEIQISNVKKGKGYISAKVEILPTEEAGRTWQEGSQDFEDAIFRLTGGSTPGSAERGE